MTLSILDKKKLLKRYGLVTIFCIVFSCIYEIFSHGVYSKYMVYAPITSLVFGLVYLIIHKYFNKYTYYIYNSLCALLIVYFYIMGILYIYGTTNKLTNIYLILIIIYIILFIISLFIKKE